MSSPVPCSTKAHDRIRRLIKEKEKTERLHYAVTLSSLFFLSLSRPFSGLYLFLESRDDPADTTPPTLISEAPGH